MIEYPTTKDHIIGYVKIIGVAAILIFIFFGITTNWYAIIPQQSIGSQAPMINPYGNCDNAKSSEKEICLQLKRIADSLDFLHLNVITDPLEDTI